MLENKIALRITIAFAPAVPGFVFVTPSAVSGSNGVARANAPSGCYRDSGGSCFCRKSSKCGCPGDCEPPGCDDKRSKEMEKEIDAEVRRARDAEKKQRYDEAARRKRAETADGVAEDGVPEAEADPPAGPGRDFVHDSANADAKGKQSKKGNGGKNGNSEPRKTKNAETNEVAPRE